MKIVSAVINNPTFIEIQHYTLKKYFKGDYEFIIFNDAKDFPDFTNSGDTTIRKQIEDTCNRLGIKCINIPNEHHKQENCAVIRCSNSMNFILDYQKRNPDRYLCLDSDMFLIHEFDIAKYANYDCAIVFQSRGEQNEYKYFWNGIYYFDMIKMKDIDLLNWSPSEKTDVGGKMQEWFNKMFENKYIPTVEELRWEDKTYHTDDIYLIKHLWSCSWNIQELPEHLQHHTKLIEFLQNDTRNENGKYFCEIYDGVFLHYRAGGNWRFEGIHFHNHHADALKNTLCC